MEEVLASLGHLPIKQNEKEAWYLNPFGTETQASFKLDRTLNLWYLFSEGIGGNNIDFMMKYQKTSVKEVLEWVEKHNFSSFQSQNAVHIKNAIPNYQITGITELQNENLKNYLQQRGFSSIVFPLVKEIHFQMGEKNLYAIGFSNLSGGWELRNSFYKGSLLKKDISVFNLNNHKKQNKNVVVFEGFLDALSFVEMKRFFKGDLLVMNSISLLNKAKEYLKNYSEIHLFLDNDRAGENCKSSILKSFPEAKDHSKIYFPNKDLNDYLLSRIQAKTENKQQKEREHQQQNNQVFKRRR
nr:toprim domain-containing protein [uncultured Flavobacterium sp.]